MMASVSSFHPNLSSKRSRRLYERLHAPRLLEQKRMLLIRGRTASQIATRALHDLATLKKPDAKLLARKSSKNNNDIVPFDDVTSLEFLARQNECSMVVLGSSNRKRPHALTLARTFNHQVLDMYELLIDPNTFKAIEEFKERKAVVRVGSKPLILFQGAAFDDETSGLKQLRNMLLDMFRGEEMDHINLVSLDHAIVISCNSPPDAAQKTIHFRHYGMLLKKAEGSPMPAIELHEAGPHMDLFFKRHKPADKELLNEALKQPKKKETLGKNLEVGSLKQQHGRLHMQRQEFKNMALVRQRGFSKRNRINGA